MVLTMNNMLTFRQLCVAVSFGLMAALPRGTVVSQDGPDKVRPRQKKGLPDSLRQRIPPRANDGGFARWAYGRYRNPEGARTHLESNLKEKLEVVDYLCRLTSDQRTALAQAGRNDLDRLFESAAKLNARVQDVKSDKAKVERLFEDNLSLQRALRVGPSGDDILLAKELDVALTADQLLNYDPVRDVFRVGGQMKLKQEDGTAELDVRLQETPFDDAGFVRLLHLTEVLSLDLSETRVTDAALARIGRPAKIRNLSLRLTAVTDKGLACVRSMTNLRSLNLFRTSVTDAGLAEIEGAGQLQLLDLSETAITDAGLARLTGLLRLRHLSLYGTRVTDAGLAHLGGMRELQNLDLSQTEVTDAGLDRLEPLKGLRILSLSGTSVSDAGLSRLARLTSISQLALTGTKVTKSGRAMLQKQLPKTDIVR